MDYSRLKPCSCGNEYLAIRTDVYKDKREFVYCDCCGALGTVKLWQARDDGASTKLERDRCIAICQDAGNKANDPKISEQIANIISAIEK